MERTTHLYRNPWYKKDDQSWGNELFACSTRPTQYRGFLIFNRAGGFDLVKDGTCIAQRVTSNGCKLVADGIIAGSEDYFVKQAANRLHRFGDTENPRRELSYLISKTNR